LRMRNIPDADERIARHASHVAAPAALKGKWRDHLHVSGPLHVELGSGKGQFITTLASRHPDTAFVAIERFATILVQLVKRLPEEGLTNLAVLNMDARELEVCFAPGEIDRIYLNFSDPWPKVRHANRRLTFRSFLDIYRVVLSEHGDLHFKTDNIDLFDYSLESLPAAGWTIGHISRNLHAEPWSEDNIKTEYEEKFSGLGHPIHWLTASPDRKEA